MDDRVKFASLILACHLGVLSKNHIIAIADQRISELNEIEPWLAEISLYGKSAELDGLIVRGYSDDVYAESLRMLFQSWIEGAISDENFATSCRMLWHKAGNNSRWYEDLVWIPDEFYLVEDGVYYREDSVKKIRSSIEKILEEFAV